MLATPPLTSPKQVADVHDMSVMTGTLSQPETHVCIVHEWVMSST